MFSRLASYLLGGAASGAEDAESSQHQDGGSEPTTVTAASAEAGVTAVPVEARLRQVEVEGEDWILIDRNVEGVTGMDESWYVTPPACFTQPGPVHVETSPLEDLLIEHPSMSVYRAAGPKPHHHHHHHHHHKDKKPAESSKRAAKRRTPISEIVKPIAEGAYVPRLTLTLPARPSDATNAISSAAAANGGAGGRLPLAVRNGNETAHARKHPKANSNSSSSNNNNSASSNNRTSHHHHHHHNHHHQHNNNTAGAGAVAEQAPRRSSMRDLRSARGDENVRIVQIRSAQKILEKRASQSAKRNRLERGNKAREVASGTKGRRPRRQDRLRLNNSGANNNRKC